MLNKLILASLVTFAATTSLHADTAAPRPARLPIAQLWEIDMRADVPALPTSTITVWTNGAWTITQRDHGKVTTQTGTMAGDAFTKLGRVLATATWKSTPQKGYRCMAESASYTVYSYQGKQVMVSRLCDGLEWDQPTREAVARATELTNVFALTGTKPVPPKG